MTDEQIDEALRTAKLYAAKVRANPVQQIGKLVRALIKGMTR